MLSKYSMPAAASPTICSRVFTRRRAPSVLRKVRKSPPRGESSLEPSGLGDTGQTEPSPRRPAPLLTLNQLHNNVDRLFLCADPDETYDVGMVVLFQDPGEHYCLGYI